jgi:hypothetical protein
VLQLIEGSVLVPLIMRNAVGISPLLILLSLLIGAAVAGIVGALLAVPVAASVRDRLSRLSVVVAWPALLEPPRSGWGGSDGRPLAGRACPIGDRSHLPRVVVRGSAGGGPADRHGRVGPIRPEVRRTGP